MMFIVAFICLITLGSWVLVVIDYREALSYYGSVHRRRAIDFLLRIFWPIGLLYVICLFFHSVYCIFKIAINGKD